MSAVVLGMMFAVGFAVAEPDASGRGTEAPVVTAPPTEAPSNAAHPADADRGGAAIPGLPPGFTSPAAGFDAGNAALEQGDLAAAEAAYRAVIAVVPDADVYFNLGNVLWRKKAPAGAILAWRTAAVSAPRDPDVAANLEFAHRFVQDALAVPSNVPAWAPWMGALTVGEAAWTSTALVGLALVALGLRRKAPHVPVLGMAGVVVGVGGVLGAGAVAQSLADPLAVVLVPEVSVTSDLGGGVTLFSLHAGAEVLATEESGASVLVVLADGRRGWVPVSSLGFADPSRPFPML